MLKAIKNLGPGAVFVSSSFAEYGSKKAINSALSRLAKKGVIRRLARGIYDVPKEHPILGKLYPPPEKIAEVIAARDCARIQPDGAFAANILGLSEQVPAKVVFLTDR